MAGYRQGVDAGYALGNDHGYAEGYRAGRIAALREVGDTLAKITPGKGVGPLYQYGSASMLGGIKSIIASLLAEAESGEDTGEVGDDR